MGFTIEKEIEIEEDEIIDMIADNSDQDTVFDVIKEIDNRMGDWDFTTKLAKFFLTELLSNEMVQEAEEMLKELGYVRVKGEEDDEDEGDDGDDEDDDEEDKKIEDHSHIFRNGACWCGALP